ncbi:MAG: UDP-3-O-(3-hydroxymyristoyl)glucosamine N-acyltransferase [Vampirovibrionales bacterium]|nr:UDP-3-O-(3-hydroxymyristoyl)glucosamine N-acyltransferase [Vampirovibrionales bacterium]
MPTAILKSSSQACDALLNPLVNANKDSKPPVMTMQALAEKLGAKLVGDGTVEVARMVHPRNANQPDDLVMVLDLAIIEALRQTPVQAAILPEAGLPISADAPPEALNAMLSQATSLKAALIVARPRLAMAELLSVFNLPIQAPNAGVHPMAVVAPSARVAPTAVIGPFCTVGERASIGDGTVLMPNVTVGADAELGEQCVLQSGVRIGERVKLGNRVILHYNACVGGDGFSFVTPEAGSIEAAREGGAVGNQTTAQNTSLLRINSIGTVVIEDDVEIGSCATIDRATLGETRVARGTKIDNLVMIGHNNTIGENCLIVSQVGISGSCKIGNRVVIAGQAGLADHLSIGDDAIVTAKAGVMRNIEPREIVAGIPAMPRRQAMTNMVYMNKLKDMADDIKTLKKQLAALSKPE